MWKSYFLRTARSGSLFQILSNSLSPKPIPGLKETRYLARKKKYLDLRARMIQNIRLYFTNHDFLEVETPLRIPAPAPEEHIEAIPSGDWFLQTSPELCMKRLLAAGYPRIFQ